MAHTNNIKETIQKEELMKRCCYQCSRNFNNSDWITNNWDLEFRTNHKPAWKTFFENDDRGWIGWEVQLRHGDCKQIKEDESSKVNLTETKNQEQINHEQQ